MHVKKICVGLKKLDEKAFQCEKIGLRRVKELKVDVDKTLKSAVNHRALRQDDISH
jgi:hypothetical protein